MIGVIKMLKKYRILIILFIVLGLLLALTLILKQNQSFVQFIEGSKIAKMKQEIANKLGIRFEKDSIVKDFKEYSNDFITVVNFINSYDKTSEETMFIEKQNTTYIARISSSNGQKEVQITDIDVNKSIDRIFNGLHYRYIDEDGGNGIYFTLSDTDIGFGHGVAFSKNGKSLDGWGVRLKTTELIKDVWYYFEAE